jgi:hypothetical protein
VGTARLPEMRAVAARELADRLPSDRAAIVAALVDAAFDEDPLVRREARGQLYRGKIGEASDGVIDALAAASARIIRRTGATSSRTSDRSSARRPSSSPT